MPLLNGLEAGRQIKQKLREVELVFLTMNEDADLAAEAFRAGASAYLLKRSAASELLHGDPRGHAGPFLHHAARDRRPGRGPARPRQGPATGCDLTPRQREVLQLLAEGRSMKEVAAVLNLTPRTVAFHKYRMMKQLKHQVHRGADSVCRQAPHCLTSRACCSSTTTRRCSARSAAVLGAACDIVGAVKDGLAALEAAAALHPDVIVLDISMPGMTGLEVAARLRRMGSIAGDRVS